MVILGDCGSLDSGSNLGPGPSCFSHHFQSLRRRCKHGLSGKAQQNRRQQMGDPHGRIHRHEDQRSDLCERGDDLPDPLRQRPPAGSQRRMPPRDRRKLHGHAGHPLGIRIPHRRCRSGGRELRFHLTRGYRIRHQLRGPSDKDRPHLGGPRWKEGRTR